MPPKPKVPTSIRLDPAVRDALRRAAEADGRSASNMLDRILREWLTTNGFPPEPSPAAKPRRRKAEDDGRA